MGLNKWDSRLRGNAGYNFKTEIYKFSGKKRERRGDKGFNDNDRKRWKEKNKYAYFEILFLNSKKKVHMPPESDQYANYPVVGASTVCRGEITIAQKLKVREFGNREFTNVRLKRTKDGFHLIGKRGGPTGIVASSEDLK